MSTTWKAVLFSVGAMLVILAVLLAGFYLGRASTPAAALSFDGNFQPFEGRMGIGPSGAGMMGSGGMMGFGGMMGPGADGFGRHGFMMQGAPGWNRGHGPGMMGWFGSELSTVEPLEIEAAESAAVEYLDRLGYSGLEVAEVMIFDNHAYILVNETETGFGAMELLVDPVSGRVFPEPGPNMMWNLKYGHMATGSGMMGFGMMGRGMMSAVPELDLDNFAMDLNEERAVELAQDYLNGINSDVTADDHADAFYGYYTIHTLEGGEVVGMLSVNGFTGAVFPHTWHGELVEVSNH